MEQVTIMESLHHGRNNFGKSTVAFYRLLSLVWSLHELLVSFSQVSRSDVGIVSLIIKETTNCDK